MLFPVLAAFRGKRERNSQGARQMSEIYLGNDGFRPLPLPQRGEDLQPGRQYYLDPVARCTVEDIYGLRGVPSIIECILAKRPATRIFSTTENMDTGEVKQSEPFILARQHETFRAFIKFGSHFKFTIDLEKVHELRAYYANSPKVKDYEKSDEKPRSNGPKERKPIDLSILD